METKRRGQCAAEQHPAQPLAPTEEELPKEEVNIQSTKETSRGRDRKSAGGDSKLESANLVPQANKDDVGQAHTSKAINKTRFPPLGSGGSSSITSKTKSDGLRLIREKMKTLVVILGAYRQNRRICVYTCLKQYLKRTKLLRSSSQLFVSTQSPHNGVSKDTLARWIRLILSKSGVNTKIFKAHSFFCCSQRHGYLTCASDRWLV
ncbi:integrase/recombinase xerd [Plakobranchus ocellatus]|uniref:Integrase/recombinase xerd n=1 Tax=Plakobranchus ocellatus TaxID=259542 RepID=A0AAV3XUN8_9GAST|nr:integrase/recombinase xerd [Plakobranchus ocellatus]